MSYNIKYRQSLTPEEITVLVDSSFEKICKRLKIILQEYPDLSQCISDESYILIESKTQRKIVDRIRMGACEKSYAENDPPELYQDAANELARGVCINYGLQTNGGHEIEYARLVRYFAGMLTSRFSRKWLGRKLERE
jgi:hypothetical protein